MRTKACLACFVFLPLVSIRDVDAQQTAAPKRVGVVSVGLPGPYAPLLTALREGLREHGWIEGQDIVVEARYAEGRLERLADIAAELIRLPVDVLVTSRVPPTLALKKATGSVPIVSAAATDPAETGLVTPDGKLGCFRCAREVLAGMVARRRGRIVNITGGAAFNRLPRMTAYCATKAAVAQWTKILAEDTRAHGISVFAFHPRVVRTSMVMSMIESPDLPKELGDRFRTRLDQGRDTPIERCNQMLLFLVSGRADALSGRFIRTEDDEDELMRRAEEIQRNDLHTLTLRTLPSREEVMCALAGTHKRLRMLV